MVVAMADPDVEVAVDPGAGEDRRQRLRRTRRRLGHRDGLDVGGVRQRPVQRAQERPAAAVVILPGVLAVEDDRNGRDFPAAGLRESPARGADVLDEIGRGRAGVPRLVVKADAIRHRVIAEQRDRAVRRRRDTAGTAAPGRIGIFSERDRMSSSVAIHFRPAAAISATASSETDPSEGHMPDGRLPNVAS